ncbi:MAG: hypothetical protein LAO08_20200 [Acidobacteriia bacterium]|nr:hypothetical protein [Terriglobia bacterium]
MNDQNPTQKGNASEIPTLVPKCPHCSMAVPGLNVSTIILPTPQNPQGDLTFLVPCCPLCNKIITAQFVGHTPRTAGVSTPPSNLWAPGRGN